MDVSLTEAAPQLLELPRDDTAGPRVEVDDGCDGQRGSFQMVDYHEVASTLFDVALDCVEDGQELALAIRVEPSQGACDRLDARDGLGVVGRGLGRQRHVRARDREGRG